MKRSSISPADPEEAFRQLDDWRRRSVQAYEDRLREEGVPKVRSIGRNRERSEAELLRAYGPPERREMVKKEMVCCVPGCSNPAENAHIENGGMGRKADANRIAPICRGHHTDRDDSLHALGSVERFDEVHGTDLELEAELLEEAWQERRAA